MKYFWDHNLETIEEVLAVVVVVDDDDDDEFLASSFCMSSATLASPLATSILVEK